MLSAMYKDKIAILGVEIEREAIKVLDFDVAKLHTRNSIKVPRMFFAS